MSYLLRFGWYETDSPCPMCRSNRMIEDGQRWICEGCRGARLSDYGDLPAVSDSFYRWQRQHAFLESCEARLRDLHEIGGVYLEEHPLGDHACRTCDSNGPWLAAARLSSNGVKAGMAFCATCGYSSPSRLLAKLQLDPSHLPVQTWRSCCDGKRCEKCSEKCAHRLCESYAVEHHHYLPYALAIQHGESADDWPVGPLCPEHHRLWHRIVTPNLNRKQAS